MKNKIVLASILLLGSMNTAFALNSLQLGPGAGGTWNYDTSDDTWDVSDGTFDLNAYANCLGTGCNGDYAWADTDTNRYAYLVVAAVPQTATDPAFSISISGATMIDSGFGNPPLTDSNDLAPHGIYDTYFQIYEFQFDGPIGTIYDTQPGTSGSGLGYTESFAITVDSLAAGVDGVHFDLFSVLGGRYILEGNNLVDANAPYSHDAEYNCCTRQVPAPSAALLLGLGLLGMGALRKKVS